MLKILCWVKGGCPAWLSSEKRVIVPGPGQSIGKPHVITSCAHQWGGLESGTPRFSVDVTGQLLEASLCVCVCGGGLREAGSPSSHPWPRLWRRSSGASTATCGKALGEQAQQSCSPLHSSWVFCFTGSTPLASLQSPPHKPHRPQQGCEATGLALALLEFLHPRFFQVGSILYIRSRQGGYLLCLSPLRLLQ